MAREWQQTRLTEYLMPDAVYYQTIWAVRDLGRIEERIKEIEESSKSGYLQAASVVSDGKANYENIKPTEKNAIEKTMLETRAAAIKQAMSEVPPTYLEMIMDNIVNKTQVYGYLNKIWRTWKQRMLYKVAKNLSLI